jgi:hypothetical protein
VSTDADTDAGTGRGADAGYVHRPDGPASAGAAGSDAAETADADPEEGLGRKGWVLVAAVFVSVLVLPGVVYLLPSVAADAGVPFLVAMLVLPMVPAVILGVTAVWSMTAGRDDR